MHTVEVLERLKYIASRPRLLTEAMMNPPKAVAKAVAYAKRVGSEEIAAEDLMEDSVLLEVLEKAERYYHSHDVIEGRIPAPDYEEELVDLVPGTDVFRCRRSLADAHLALMYLYAQEFECP